MTPLRIVDSPDLNEPTLIAAFAGWSDAGAAATTAAHYLVERWHAKLLAEIDAEQFYDFTQLRPTVRYVEDDRRTIEWPKNNFYYHRTPDKDLIILAGIEPHLHWRTYVDAVLEVIETFHVSLVVSLGALGVDFPHTRPVRVTGMAPTPEMGERAKLVNRGRGRYEGPTGISGVLSTTLRESDTPFASLWANVPHYIAASPNPAAALALLRSLSAMLEVEIPLGRLFRASADFETQLNEATSKNAEVMEYVRALEQRLDDELEEAEDFSQTELPAPELLVKDIEDFLRRSSSE